MCGRGAAILGPSAAQNLNPAELVRVKNKTFATAEDCRSEMHFVHSRGQTKVTINPETVKTHICVFTTLNNNKTKTTKFAFFIGRGTRAQIEHGG